MNSRPLDGIRVLEIAAYISGPYSGALLGAMGAEVVKVEPPEGDAFRLGKDADSPFFAQYNSGKKSIAVNLKSPEGIEAIKALLPKFDVVIENMRPGKLEALGLSAEVCRAINPKLIYTSVSGFGSGGPYRDRPAFDSIGQSLGGLYSILNDDGDMQLTGTILADLITAIGATIAILSALVGRGGVGDGKGAHVETSVFEAVSMLTIDAITQAAWLRTDPVRDTRHSQAQNFCLKTASGDFITIHLSSSKKFWHALARAAGREDLLSDPRFATYDDRVIRENYREITRAMEEAFLTQPRAEWERRLAEADVPFAPALTMREVEALPQTQWLGMIGRDRSGRPLVQPPWRFDGERPTRSKDIPALGEHTRAILSEVMSDREIDALTGFERPQVRLASA